jgi:hypothetical protein
LRCGIVADAEIAASFYKWIGMLMRWIGVKREEEEECV